MKKSNLNAVRSANAKLELGGVEYNIRYDLNAFAEIEDTHGSITELLAKMEKGSIKAIRAMVWAGLQCNGHCPTEKEVGSLIGLNDIAKVTFAIQSALTAALPETNEENEKN